MDDRHVASVTTSEGEASVELQSAPPHAADAERDAAVLDDLLVEEVSIDGMCGVY